MKQFSEIKYVRPDFKKIKEDLKAYTQGMKKAKDFKEFMLYFKKIEKVFKDLSTMGTVASIRNTLDVNDAFYEKEYIYVSEQFAKMNSLEEQYNKAFLSSKFRKDFDKKYTDTYSKGLEYQNKLLSPKIVPLQIEEDKLCQIYSKDAANCKTEFRGETCNFYGLLKHMESTDRQERREAFEAWAKLYEEVSPKLDDTYDKLVKIRRQKAEILGLDSYIDYAYLDIGRYYYTKDDVAVFRQQVKDYIVPVCEKLYKLQEKNLGVDKLRYYDEALFYPEGNAIPIGNKDELVEKARKMYEELSPETGEFFNFMTKYQLFDLETKPGKHMGGYCTDLNKYKAPFIFSNFNGTSADVDVLTHEAGHAFQFYLSARKQPFMYFDSSTPDICEIHSMTMEHWAYPWMESFFGENADKYRLAHLTNALCIIPYLVCVDEFQHRVFEKPDMTAMDRRGVWREIEKKYMPWRDYDGNEFLEAGGFWMQKQHIFLYPFYYIDYALAQVCAFNIFARSQDDRQAAWKDYLALCKAGGSKGYFDLLKIANVPSPFKEGTVKQTVDKISEILKKFEEKVK